MLQVNQQEALSIARDFAGADRVRQALPGPEMGGPIPCWGVALTLDGITLQDILDSQAERYANDYII